MANVEIARCIPPSTLRGRLRDSREWRGLEQVDVAKELGVSRATVSNYERGVTNPSKLVVNAWAVVCNVDVEWLNTGIAPTDDGRGDDVLPRLDSNQQP
ncbi:MAG: helix-turn-helix transcriptional regulator, partial [Pseudoclavibacter sp.]